MPTTWTEPETVIEHNGVKVYHTYKGGECVSEYWYTTVETDDDIDGESAFDIRDLDVDIDSSEHVDILRAAIVAGLLKAEE